jgi:hypothetical protein
MEAVCAFAAGRPASNFNFSALKLDALVAIYNKLPCIQNDPMLVMQGTVDGCGRPPNSS